MISAPRRMPVPLPPAPDLWSSSPKKPPSFLTAGAFCELGSPGAGLGGGAHFLAAALARLRRLVFAGAGAMRW